MDADDIAKSHRIARQVTVLAACPEVDLIGSSIELFGATSYFQAAPPSHREIRDHYLINSPFFHPTVMIRRKAGR
jgi:hypothetical protein